MSETFKFKKFTVSQDRCAMKVGTDGVLLGAWANGGSHILDIGSGTGLIALMMAQRYPNAEVEGVEIDREAAAQSLENISESPFHDRISVQAVALQAFRPSRKFDSIVTNPPFFVGSLTPPDRLRSVARHARTLRFADIFTFASEWLTDDGELSAVIPSESMDDFSAEAFIRGFFLTRQYGIKTAGRKPVRRYLLAFGKHRTMTFDNRTVVLSDGGGVRSEWYGNLTKDFYIK